MAKIYNRLSNPALQFANLWRLSREYTVRAVGVPKRKIDDLGKIAGDGRYGFPSRHQKKDGSNITTTVDGTGHKKLRKSVVRPRKAVCRLISSAELERLVMNPELKARRNSEAKKAKRANKRNNGARCGRRKAVVYTTNNTKGKRGGLTPTCVNR